VASTVAAVNAGGQNRAGNSPEKSKATQLRLGGLGPSVAVPAFSVAQLVERKGEHTAVVRARQHRHILLAVDHIGYRRCHARQHLVLP
jgi:hypothetical protein